jgi:hypothetical protein
METSLKRRVSRDERLQVSQQALITKRKKQFLFVENQEVKQTCNEFGRFESYARDHGNILGLPDQLKQTIFSVENQTCSSIGICRVCKGESEKE